MPGDHRADAVVNVTEPGMTARGPGLPPGLELPEGEELLVHPPGTAVAGDFLERPDNLFVATAGRSDDEAIVHRVR